MKISKMSQLGGAMIVNSAAPEFIKYSSEEEISAGVGVEFEVLQIGGSGAFIPLSNDIEQDRALENTGATPKAVYEYLRKIDLGEWT